MMFRHIHQYPPMQNGEAERLPTRVLWRYFSQHYRWMKRQCPFIDNYLALHRADAAWRQLRARGIRV